MESDAFDLTEAQRTLERAEAAPYVDYPPTPWWYYPAFGAWSAAYVALLGLWDDHSVLLVAGMVLLAAVIGGFLGWYQRYHGAMPRPFRGPREFRPAYAFYGLGTAAVVGLVTAAWLLVGHPAAIVTAFAATALALHGYERAYATAARRTRERLG